MGSHSFGSIFRITTWGESHGPAIGVVIDGCPSGLPLSVRDLIPDLKRRSPGQLSMTSPRSEDDSPEILSGVFEGVTTGAPISIMIRNTDCDSAAYDVLKNAFRPGHANFTYLAKYGVFDHRGGGRASARETTCRVAAGAIAKKLLKHWGISCEAYVVQIGSLKAQNLSELHRIYESGVYCPDLAVSQQMVELLAAVKEEGDSLGGVVEFRSDGMPSGLGDPVYEKLEANLADAMLSIPATKGFELGEGFQAACMRGSEHNDPFVRSEDGATYPASNHAGGTLGGISTGLPLIGRVVFKPPSSIRKPQETMTLTGEKTTLTVGLNARHDPCVAIRAVPVVCAMLALVLVDAVLLNRTVHL
jgi:chorismate synthase